MSSPASTTSSVDFSDCSNTSDGMVSSISTDSNSDTSGSWDSNASSSSESLSDLPSLDEGGTSPASIEEPESDDFSSLGPYRAEHPPSSQGKESERAPSSLDRDCISMILVLLPYFDLISSAQVCWDWRNVWIQDARLQEHSFRKSMNKFVNIPGGIVVFQPSQCNYSSTPS